MIILEIIILDSTCEHPNRASYLKYCELNIFFFRKWK